MSRKYGHLVIPDGLSPNCSTHLCHHIVNDRLTQAHLRFKVCILDNRAYKGIRLNKIHNLARGFLSRRSKSERHITHICQVA